MRRGLCPVTCLRLCELRACLSITCFVPHYLVVRARANKLLFSGVEPYSYSIHGEDLHENNENFLTVEIGSCVGCETHTAKQNDVLGWVLSLGYHNIVV